MGILVNVLGSGPDHAPLPVLSNWKIGARELVLLELEYGEKSSFQLAQLIRAKTGRAYSGSSVYKYVLMPLREQGTISCRKKGMEGGWFWGLAPRAKV